MGSRIFFLPGYGEHKEVFNELAPMIHGYELKFIDYRMILSQVPVWKVNGREIAQLLVRHYGIREGDKLIGHSMGGYFSFLIREALGNDICMISSFSDPGKVIHMLPNPYFTPLLAVSGITKMPWAKNYMYRKVRGKAVERPMMNVIDGFKNFSNEDLFKLALITLEPKPVSILPNPLRLHAKDDKVVRIPDEPFVEVTGGHFPLNIVPGDIIKELSGFLE